MEKTSRRRKYIGKHVKPTDENIMQLLMPSILGMLICMVCLAGATWAWFTATTTVSVPPVSAAYFDVTTVITPEASVTDDDENEVRTYTIEKNKPYTVTLTATGNASIGGYCKVTVDDDTYYTPHMSTNVNSEGSNTEIHTFSFNVCSSSGEITIIPYWGKTSDNSVNIISDKTIGSGTVQSAYGKDSETPEENTGGGDVNSGGGETGGSDNAANKDNAGDHNTLQSEQPSSPPANEDKGDSSDNNGGSSLDSADTTSSTSDNSADSSHDSSSASDSGSGRSDSGSGSGGDSDSSSSGSESSSGGDSSGSSDS